MEKFKFGNAPGLVVPVTTDNDTYIIGNGQGVLVDIFFPLNTNGPHTGDTVTVSNGDGDSVLERATCRLNSRRGSN